MEKKKLPVNPQNVKLNYKKILAGFGPRDGLRGENGPQQRNKIYIEMLSLFFNLKDFIQRYTIMVY